MNRTVIVIDGMGGGVGAQLIARLKELSLPDLELIALGTNSSATERMVKAGAARGATGENAIKTSARLGDFILGPIGIVLPNSLMGEITPVMADAVLSAPGERILLPLQQDHFHIVGAEPLPLGRMLERTVELLRERLRDAGEHQAV
ncbi:DUF3842 family protein [Breznakiella homolactica]|uniref:DUF3842 family protein n=1 Tax=Breznakiella homolactica TaxID=2798577 RepID=A0A7T8BCN0_9SPIR|nr:DUF3842 family protein [Breznakiella homolactica]QQO10443.1 DUF3842 family protein [Breznakiella homolactica]